MANYKIYQTENRTYVFAGFDFAQKNGLSMSDYKEVYSGKVDTNLFPSDMSILDDTFETFNINHPKDFFGRSLSVSDIVEIDNRKYYCDNFGWKRMTA